MERSTAYSRPSPVNSESGGWHRSDSGPGRPEPRARLDSGPAAELTVRSGIRCDMRSSRFSHLPAPAKYSRSSKAFLVMFGDINGDCKGFCEIKVKRIA
eukprot:763450-Hanusia_phi.AAC.6